MDIIVGTIVGIAIFMWFANLMSSAAAVHDIRTKGQQWAKEFDEDRDRKLGAIAKERNVYYNKVVKCFEEDFNYDGTPKHPDARPLPHR